MNILVCVKQVPDTTEIRINPETNTLIRDGVESIVNPFDSYALELAARIKDYNKDVKIILLSMGPPQAKDAIEKCLSQGGDIGYLVSDRAFGGSDTLATSYIISEAIKQIEKIEGKCDLIFCGKQAIDGDTGQVGPEIAEHLDYPQITYAVEAEYNNGKFVVKREIEEGFEKVESLMPCIVTVTKPSFEPRYPTIKSKLDSYNAEINFLSLASISNIDSERIGLKGSPTKVKKTFTPSVKKGGIMINENSAKASAIKLYDLLSSENLV